MRKYALALLAALTFGLIGPAFAQAPPAVPALPDTERRTSYALSASTCPACSVGFALYGDSTDYGNWLELWLVTGSGATTSATKLTPVTDWTLSSVSGSLATLPRPITNATITLTSARTGTLQIVGARRPRRTSQFAENRGVAARDLNQVVTDLVAENRELWDKMGRALVTAPGDTIGALPAAAVRAGGVLGFDSSGNPTAITALTGLGNVIGPNVSVVGHIATFGNASGTLLLDGGLIGSGDVAGPASAVIDHVATFSSTTGKVLKDPGLTITPSTGTFALTNGKTLAVANSLTFNGLDGQTITFQASDTYVGRATADTLTNKTIDTAGNTFRINGTGITAITGAGSVVLATTPTLVTPVLGVATATSINKVAFTAPAIGSTLTIADGKTFTANNSITIGGTDGKTLTVSNSGVLGGGDGFTLQISAGKTLTASNSLTLSGTDGKTLTVSNSGTLAGGDGFTLQIAAGKTLTVSNTLSFTGTDGTIFAFPTASDTVAGLAATQTLSNKTLTAPTINGGTHTAISSLGIRSTGSGAFDLTLNNTENLTAGRSLTLTTNNANRTLNLSGDLTLAAAFSTAGGNAITLTGTGVTNVTLPTSGTLATRDTSQTFSSTNTFSALTTLTDIKLSSGKIFPVSDSTTALQACKADGTTCFVRLDTTNSRVGINKTPGAFDLDVTGAANVDGALTFGTGTITGLTVNNSPNASTDYLLYFNATANAIRRCTVGSCSAAGVAGVSSLNGLTGGLSIVQGTAISVSAAGTSITVANTMPGIGTNILVNGSLDIWQRGTANVTGEQYFPDQWRVHTFATAGRTYSRQASAAGTGVSWELRAQRDSGNVNTTRFSVAQAKESVESIPYAGKAVTLSFCAVAGANFSAASSILESRVTTGTGTDQSIANMLVGGWTGFSFASVQANTISTTRTCFSQTVTLASSVTQIGVEFTATPVGTAGANDWYQVSAIKLEQGSVATTFQAEGLAAAISRAERHYQKSYSLTTAPATATSVGAFKGVIFSTGSGVYATLHTRMRAAPTIGFYSPVTGAGTTSVRDVTSGTDVGSGAATNIGETFFGCTCAFGAANDLVEFHWTASAEL